RRHRRPGPPRHRGSAARPRHSRDGAAPAGARSRAADVFSQGPAGARDGERGGDLSADYDGVIMIGAAVFVTFSFDAKWILLGACLLALTGFVLYLVFRKPSG